MNANIIREKINMKGVTVSEVAKLIGIDEKLMEMKLNNEVPFTINEATRIKEVLGLSNLEALEIFLGKRLV
ncbi:MAG: hypothetical protein ACI35S_00485 [Anaeroplasma sp.]